MITDIQQEMAGLYVLGLLPAEDISAFEAELKRNPALREEVASLNNATLALAHSLPAAALPPGDRERLMASIDAASAPAPGFQVIPNDESGWLDTPVPGFRIKRLSVSSDIGHEILMLDLAPGTRYPAHLHKDSEQLFVFSGTLLSEGRVLGPGDFLHSEPGTWHQELYSHDGCRALLVRRAA